MFAVRDTADPPPKGKRAFKLFAINFFALVKTKVLQNPPKFIVVFSKLRVPYPHHIIP